MTGLLMGFIKRMRRPLRVPRFSIRFGIIRVVWWSIGRTIQRGVSRIAQAFLAVYRAILSAILAVYHAALSVCRAIVAVILWPFRIPGMIIRLIRRGLRATWAWICAQGRMIRASPMAFYRGVIRRRDWVLAKVEYLQGESAKWKALFKTLKAPYSFLRMMGLSPQMATGLLVAGSTVGGGAIAQTTVFAEKSFERGDPGEYSAPIDIPQVYSEGDNTLRVNIGATPIGEITISDVSLGSAYPNSAVPTSAGGNVIYIGGLATSTGFSGTYLEVGELTVDRWRCSQFELSDTRTHFLNVYANSSDGMSVSPVPGQNRRFGIGGGFRADSMETQGGHYDALVVAAAVSGQDAQVDKLTLTNVLSSGGKCKLSRIIADTINIIFSTTGLDSDLATKDFVISTSTSYSVFTNNSNTEMRISAVQ